MMATESDGVTKNLHIFLATFKPIRTAPLKENMPLYQQAKPAHSRHEQAIVDG
jgi:hypothetical protein